MIAAAPEAAARTRQIAIAGNPNCGKSTLFNALTGMRQKVGNYPGVTVEKKVGRCFGAHGDAIDILDLPGTYSLQARSPDEMVSRDVLLGRRSDTPQPDAIICVIDASNLERNLYLAAQLIELQIPIVVALNMIDVAEQNGVVIDVDTLSAKLGVPVVPTVATHGKGLVELKHAISRAVPEPKFRAPMPAAIADAAADLAEQLVWQQGIEKKIAYAEAQLLLALTNRSTVEEIVPALADHVAEAQQRIRDAGLDPVSDPVEARYAWVQSIADAAKRRLTAEAVSVTDRMDAVLTHRVWGWVAFLATMAFVFFCIFTVASYPMDWIDSGTTWLSNWIGAHLPAGDFRNLLTDGVIAGVGGVIVFLPQILTLFFFIGLLEDTGYMARAAFIIDRVMSKVGLHGKSFIPMLGSFACAIPGIMATRTIENPKDRLVTILVAPLMSCSARLPVYTLLIAVLLPREQVSPLAKAGIMLSMYLLGMAAALVMAWFFKRTLLRGQTPMLLLELPPYRRPEIKVVALHMWQRAQMFLKRAGTVILALSIVLWALATYPKHPDAHATRSDALAHSFAGRIGHAIEPAIKPLGYDWKVGVGLLASFTAREVFVGTMAVIYNVEGAGRKAGGLEESSTLRDALAGAAWPNGARVFTPLVCVGLMVFYVLAMQCVSTLVIVRRETNSWKWPLFQLAYMTGLAYVAALVVYQGGRLLGFH
jgi:ferrous iron transport protein B